MKQAATAGAEKWNAKKFGVIQPLKADSKSESISTFATIHTSKSDHFWPLKKEGNVHEPVSYLIMAKMSILYIESVEWTYRTNSQWVKCETVV